MIPFFKPQITQGDMDAVADVMRSGWLTSGSVVEDFEEQLQAYLDCHYVFATSSCTAALDVVLAAYGIGRGDEVITTPYTFVATAEAIVRSGATPIFVDIDHTGLNINPVKARDAITDRTRAIIAVGVGGVPADLRWLKRICKENQIRLIEDAAHTFGAKIKDKHTCHYADVSCYSFHANKNLTTNGEGGAIATDSDWLAERVRLIRQHGISNVAWHRRNEYVYDVERIGMKANMPDTAAAMGVSQLGRFDEMQRDRRSVCWRYENGFSDMDPKYRPQAIMRGMDIESSACHLYQVLLPEGVDRDYVFSEMKKRCCMCGVHYIPLYRMGAFREMHKSQQSVFPNCENAFRRVLSLPLYPDLDYAEQEFIIAALRDIIHEQLGAKACGSPLQSVSS